MTNLTDIAWVEGHRAALALGRQCSAERAYPVLRSGWDVWTQDATEPLGIARTPHLAIASKIEVADAGLRPVLSSAMDRSDLHAGVWRQIRILPDQDAWRVEAANDATPDRFAPTGGRHYPDRAPFGTKVLGIAPADIVDFLFETKKTDQDLFDLLLAKDFKAAFKQYPDLIQLEWPQATKDRWARIGGRDCLPPVLALALYAEFCRVAHNEADLIKLSFDARGNEIFSRPYLDTIPTLTWESSDTEAVRTLVGMAPFQSTALVPPDELLRRIAPKASGAWSEAAAAAMAIYITTGGEKAQEALSHPPSPETAKALRDGIASNPRFAPVPREGKGWSLSRGHAATCWGMNWRMYAVTSLLDLAAQARAWSAQYRGGRDRLPSPKFDRDLERAIAAILYLWVEAAHPAALPAALEPIIRAKEGMIKRAAEDAGKKIESFKLPDADRSIDALATCTTFGKTICKDARAKLDELPQPGEEGYTARARAHLWLNDDGDDIAHYLRHQKQAIKQHHAVLARGDCLDKTAVLFTRRKSRLLVKPKALRRPDIRHRASKTFKMTPSIEAARCAQDIAMMVSPLAMDPVRVVNAAPHRWKAPI